MDFTAVMQNLAVGIVGGVFSSVMVSVVFYVLTEYQNEMSKAKDMIYPLYTIIVCARLKAERSINANEKIVQSAFGEAQHKFSRFEPWQFKHEVKEAMIEINFLLSDGRFINCNEKNEIILNEELIEFGNAMETQVQILEKCEREFAKGFIKRLLYNEMVILILTICFVIVSIAFGL